MERVLVLNQDYSFLNIVDIDTAFRYLECDKVTVEKESGKYRLTVNGPVPIPKIVRFVYFIRRIFKKGVKWTAGNVIIRDSRKCVYCKRTEEEVKGDLMVPQGQRKLTIDHVFPSSRGGRSTWENTVCACATCNSKKADKTPREAGMFFKDTPRQPTIMEFAILTHKTSSYKEVLEQFWEEIS